jgi:hypothetical protein
MADGEQHFSLHDLVSKVFTGLLLYEYRCYGFMLDTAMQNRCYIGRKIRSADSYSA